MQPWALRIKRVGAVLRVDDTIAAIAREYAVPGTKAEVLGLKIGLLGHLRRRLPRLRPRRCV